MTDYRLSCDDAQASTCSKYAAASLKIQNNCFTRKNCGKPGTYFVLLLVVGDNSMCFYFVDFTLCLSTLRRSLRFWSLLLGIFEECAHCRCKNFRQAFQDVI
ncbi:hypothetical protein O6H91_20G040400 [Diphasiastrum complanatum]|uniref:Uncharacterized protein n=1 Tax=Diphasiastrum complanatum TaxID=34168 RepID=A0ACC2APG9_DIPCM|nr:hypothetical protein O6H91_20G040400 [Diphasiastrum complanatum]